MRQPRFILACLALVALWTVAFSQHTSAAYNGGIVRVNEAKGDGTYRLVVGFTGNAGEPEVRKETTIDGGATAASLKQWGIAQVGGLAAARTLANAAVLQVGQTFDLTPPAASVATALQTWQIHALRCTRLLALKPGVTNATLLGEITTECGLVDSTFVAGYGPQY
jgi:hypothetical protein